MKYRKLAISNEQERGKIAGMNSSIFHLEMKLTTTDYDEFQQIAKKKKQLEQERDNKKAKLTFRENMLKYMCK